MTKLLGVVTVGIVAALALTACGPRGKIRIYRGDTEIFARNLETGQKLALGQGDLASVSSVPIDGGDVWLKLEPLAPTVVIPTKHRGQAGPSITLHRQVEAHLFARDPQEVFETLTGMGHDHASFHRLTWLRETRTRSASAPPWFLPDDAVVPFPFAPDFNPQPTVLRPVVPRDFWQDESPVVRAGPGNEPSGRASVKAVRVLPVGLCSTEQRLQDLINDIGQQVSTGFLRGACRPGELDGEIYYLDSVSSLSRQRPDRALRGDDDAGGGFLLQGRVRAHDSGVASPLSFDDCSVSFNFDYRFYLNDGRLAIAHTRHQYDYDPDLALCSGFAGQTGFADTLADALQAQLEEGVLGVAKGRQLFTRQDAEWNCALGTPVESTCAKAAYQLQLGITSGADVLGIPSASASRMVAAARRPENWQCSPTPANVCANLNGHCEYLVRARRINVTPQEVELVWFDEIDEYDNPTFALFVASFAPDPATGAVDYEAYRRLCSRPPSGVVAPAGVGAEGENFYNKRFAHFRLDGTRCNALPPPAPPAPPPPRLQCPCASDADCPPDVGCDLRRRRCRGLCVSDSDCDGSGICLAGIFRCSGAECVYPYNDSMCQPYEYCKGDPSGFGVCTLKSR